uniref:Cyclin-dependent kinase F-4-like n=1 Tax=Rhizophora mucronata TaxID=61149 RepID=A0A2P2MHL8_RHIMU
MFSTTCFPQYSIYSHRAMNLAVNKAMKLVHQKHFGFVLSTGVREN